MSNLQADITQQGQTLDDAFPFEEAALERSIPDRFEQVARRYPDQIAIKNGEQAITYAVLDRVANHLAHAILARLGAGSEPVALLFAQGPEAIIGILAVLKAGKFYVPLAPSTPLARNKQCLKHSGASLLVTDNRNHSLAVSLVGRQQVLNIEKIDTDSPAESPGLSIPPDADAALYYTSGSTGDPKGVRKSHRFILQPTRWDISGFPITVGNRVPLLASYTFGASRNVIFNALLAGYKDGTVLFDGEYFDMGYFAAFWSASEYDTINGVSIFLYVTRSSVLLNDYDKTSGLSVRCIED